MDPNKKNMRWAGSKSEKLFTYTKKMGMETIIVALQIAMIIISICHVNIHLEVR